jgi:hypothetical protein
MYLFLHTNILPLQDRCIYMRKTASPLNLDLHREPCFWWGRNRRRARGPESWSMYAFIERSHINTCRFGPSSATSNSPCWSLFCASVSALWSQLVLAASSTLDTPVAYTAVDRSVQGQVCMVLWVCGSDRCLSCLVSERSPIRRQHVCLDYVPHVSTPDSDH